MSPRLDGQERDELEIVVLTQLRDSISLMNGHLTRQGDKIDDVRERIISMEARDVEADLTSYKQEMTAYKVETAKRLDAHADGIRALQLSEARYKGLFIPLSIFGSAMLTGFAVTLLQFLIKAGGHS